MLAAVLMAFMAVDPRGRGLGVVQGAYEKQLLLLLPDLWHRVTENLPALFVNEIPEAFFSERMTGLGLASSLVLMAGAVLVTRRQPLWGLQVLILTAIMVIISDVPRYYLMVLPTLWLGYVLAILLLTARARPVVRDLALFALFSVANVQNIGGAIKLCIEQHSTRSFVATYKRGSYEPLIRLAGVLRKNMGPADRAIGPSGQILSYFSGRAVFERASLGLRHAAAPAATPTWSSRPGLRT